MDKPLKEKAIKEEFHEASDTAYRYVFHSEDVKEACLEFEHRFYRRNKPGSNDHTKKIMTLFKEIFGDFDEDTENGQ